MRYAVDASFFFSEAILQGELVTPPSVIEEISDVRSRCRLEALLATGLSVVPPSEESRRRTTTAAGETGDITRLSPADTDLLALSLDLGAVVVTDDYAVQNVAQRLGLGIEGILQRKARPRRWKFRCPACNRRYSSPGTCPVCGSPLSRSLK
ncbi:MAG: nucleotide-binding protein [Methanomicrobiales archaeon]|nr:nucleotide-binding protein [Methanomicrobiales archaeon]MDD1668161.1 nucleotide-binding protein [Methanomicrobiales archaeon]